MRRLLLLALPVLYGVHLQVGGIPDTGEVLASVLNLTESEFFAADRSVLEPRESRLLEMDFFGIVVNAPKQILTSRHDKLPLILATRTSGERGWDVALTRNCILVGTNLQDGSVRFAQALVSEKDLMSRDRAERVPKGPRPPGLADAGAQLTELDARRRLNIGWNTGMWALSVIHYDWSSNVAVVELRGDESAPPAPARSVHPPLGGDGAERPSYLPMSGTPTPPDTGVSFIVEPVVEEGRSQLKVLGSLVVAVRERHLPSQKIVHEYGDGRQESVQAVIPVTLAVLALNWDEPLVFDWAVPVYGAELEVGMPARGYFAIDVGAKAVGHLLSGKYVAFLIMEGVTYGPVNFEISRAG